METRTGFFSELRTADTGTRDAVKLATASLLRIERGSMTAMVASSEVVTQALSNDLGGLSGVLDGMNSAIGILAADIDEWLSVLTDYAKLQTDYMRAMLETLQAPLDTQAKELRKRAQEAYANRWFDDAERDFSQSAELNRYDFTVHHALGLIRLSHRHDPASSVPHFEKAARYAEPRSKWDAALAEIGLANAYLDQQDLRASLEHADTALRHSPEMPEALYARARALALKDGENEALATLLARTLMVQPLLSIVAVRDLAFAATPDSLSTALERVRETLKQNADQLLPNVEAAVAAGRRHAERLHGERENVLLAAVLECGSTVATLRGSHARNTILDLLALQQQLPNASAKCIKRLRDAAEQVISMTESANAKLKVQLGQEQRRGRTRLRIFLVPAIAGSGYLLASLGGREHIDPAWGAFVGAVLGFPIADTINAFLARRARHHSPDDATVSSMRALLGELPSA